MFDNFSNRLHEVFSYGLYRGPDILKQKGVEPRNPRIAKAEGYTLKVGRQATLLRSSGKTAYGIVYALTHAEIKVLYQGSGLLDYAAEALLVEVGGQSMAALCCNLIESPAADESNPEYTKKAL